MPRILPCRNPPHGTVGVHSAGALLPEAVDAIRHAYAKLDGGELPVAVCACTIAAKAVGVGPVIVSDVAAARHKLELARIFGADATIVADQEPVVEKVRELTRDQLADVVIDVSAYATKPVVDAIDVVKPGGTVVLAGLKGPKEVPGFLNDKVVMQAITIKGVFGVDRPAYAQAIRIIESGRFSASASAHARLPTEAGCASHRDLGG